MTLPSSLAVRQNVEPRTRMFLNPTKRSPRIVNPTAKYCAIFSMIGPDRFKNRTTVEKIAQWALRQAYPFLYREIRRLTWHWNCPPAIMGTSRATTRRTAKQFESNIHSWTGLPDGPRTIWLRWVGLWLRLCAPLTPIHHLPVFYISCNVARSLKLAFTAPDIWFLLLINFKK